MSSEAITRHRNRETGSSRTQGSRDFESVIFPKAGKIMYMKMKEENPEEKTKRDIPSRSSLPTPAFPLRYEKPHVEVLCSPDFTATSIDIGGLKQKKKKKTIVSWSDRFAGPSDGSQIFVAACGSGGHMYVKDIVSDR